MFADSVWEFLFEAFAFWALIYFLLLGSVWLYNSKEN